MIAQSNIMRVGKGRMLTKNHIIEGIRCTQTGAQQTQRSSSTRRNCLVARCYTYRKLRAKERTLPKKHSSSLQGSHLCAKFCCTTACNKLARQKRYEHRRETSMQRDTHDSRGEKENDRTLAECRCKCEVFTAIHVLVKSRELASLRTALHKTSRKPLSMTVGASKERFSKLCGYAIL